MAIDRGWRAKARYRLDEFIGGGAGKQMAVLAMLTAALVGTFTLVGAVLGVGAADGGLIETAWFYFGRVIDAGTFTADEGWLNRIVSTAVSILGVVVAGLLISSLSGNFQDRLEGIRRSGSPVMETGHFLILGWSEKIYSVLDQLTEAYASEGRIVCVVMAEGDKVALEEKLRDNVQRRDRMKLVVRTGSSTSLHDLEKVNFAETRAIVVLLDESDVEDADRADARVMKTLMAIYNHPDASTKQERLRVTAEVMQSESQDLAVIASNGRAQVIRTNEMISKIILQTCRIRGLSLVYDELLRFEGNEIHFKTFPQTVGKTFGDVLLEVPDACVIGVAKQDGSGHVLNPPADHVVGADEALLLLAEDASVTHRAYNGGLRLSAFGSIPSSAKRSVDHVLVLGWNSKVYPIVAELDGYIAPGSTVTLVNTVPIAERERLLAQHVGALANVEVRHVEGTFASRSVMTELDPTRYPTVIVLGDATDTKSAEEADTRAIIALLLLRDARSRAEQVGDQRICTEILEPKNRDLAAITAMNDVVISNEMISMVMAQVSYEPRVQAVFEDLLRSEGSEIYIKPLELYVPPGKQATFEHLVLAAKARGEVALGLQIYEDTPANRYGLVLNPKERARPFVPKAGDRLVVLADEDG